MLSISALSPTSPQLSVLQGTAHTYAGGSENRLELFSVLPCQKISEQIHVYGELCALSWLWVQKMRLSSHKALSPSLCSANYLAKNPGAGGKLLFSVLFRVCLHHFSLKVGSPRPASSLCSPLNISDGCFREWVPILYIRAMKATQEKGNYCSGYLQRR